MKYFEDNDRENPQVEAQIPPAEPLLLTGFALACSVSLIYEKKLHKGKLCLAVMEKADQRRFRTFESNILSQSYQHAHIHLHELKEEFDRAILSVDGYLRNGHHRDAYLGIIDAPADATPTLILQMLTPDSSDTRIVTQCYRPESVGESFALIGEASLLINGKFQYPGNWLSLLKEGIAQHAWIAERWQQWRNAGTN